MTDTEWNQELMAYINKASEYREMGLHGEPCFCFPGLGAGSSEEDIDCAAASMYDRILQKIGIAVESKDQVVGDIVTWFFRMYAAAYVAGIRERARKQNGAGGGAKE